MSLKTILILLLLLATCVSCTVSAGETVSMFPPKQFAESDLFGKWEVSNARDSFESLELMKDNTFSQTFKLIDSDYLFETNGTWKITTDDTGCLYIHLQGMRFYYQVFEIAENGNKWDDGSPEYYWDSCAKRPVQMVSKTILSVGSHPDSSNGIVLWHMSSQREAIVNPIVKTTKRQS